MKIVPLAEVTNRFSAYVDAAKESAIVVTRNGKPVALLTPILDDDDLDTLLLTHDRGFVRLLTQARERVQSGQYLNNKPFWGELRRRGTRRSVRKTKAATRRRG